MRCSLRLVGSVALFGLVGFLLGGCGAGGGDSQSTTSTADLVKKAADCQQTKQGTSGGMPWMVVLSAVRDNECATDQVLATITECLDQTVGKPRLVRTTDLIACVGRGLPDVSVVGGPRTLGGSLMAEFVPASKTPAQPDCTTGVGNVDPRLAGGEVSGTGLQFLKVFMQFGPVVYSFKPLDDAYVARIDAASQDDPAAQAKAQQDVESTGDTYNKTVQAAQAGSDVPTSTTAKGVIKDWAKKVVTWITLKGTDLYNSVTSQGTGTTASDTGTTPSEGGEATTTPEGGGGKPSNTGEPTACQAAAEFIADCAASGWKTAPCQLFLTSLANPHCDPLVALTVEGAPCAVDEPTQEEKQAAFETAMVRCWSRVKPSPDGGEGVCSVRTGDELAFFVRQPSGDACSDPKAMTTEGQCVQTMTDPEQAVTNLVGAKPNPLDLLIINSTSPEPKPPPKPE
jgi:hypothetical protein